jgi:hypothetical protein
MAMSKAKAKLKVGTVIPVAVTREKIDRSLPCDKGKCMLTLSGISVLESEYGPGNYNVKSTNHGMTFDINGHRLLTVFDHLTAHRIFQYDEIYKKTRSIAKARAWVKPFKAKLMVESNQKIRRGEPMSAETKKQLRDLKARGRAVPRIKSGIRMSNRRQLSE